MTSHTTNSKTPTDQALEPSAGPAHHDAAILRQPGGQHHAPTAEPLVTLSELADMLGTEVVSEAWSA
jgi:hypothetical protein